MKKVVHAAACLAVLGAAAPALAADGAGLTIYSSGFGMVRESRTLALPQGVGEVVIPGVPREIRPDTVLVRAEGLSVLESGFLPETLTPQELYRKYIGRTVTLVRVNPATGAETREQVDLLAANDGLVVRRNGQIEAVRPDGTFTRVALDAVPEGLAAVPTLALKVNSSTQGTRPVNLSYLTNGLGWQADYVGSYDEGRGVLSLQGWATLRNDTDADFRNSRVQLMAGNVNVEQRYDRPVMAMAKAQSAPMMEAGAAPDRESMGDFQLYTLPQPVTLLRNQTKQVALVTAQAVKAERSYRFELWGPQTFEQAQNADIRVTFKNAKGNGLGEPLPAGTVRLYGQDRGGNSQFLGEDRVRHTPENGEIDLTLGKAFDVTVKPTQLDQKVLSRSDGPRLVEWSMSYEVANAKDQAVTVDLRQSGLSGEWEVLEESRKHERLDSDTIRWKVPVPAKGATTVTVKVRQRG